MGRVPRVVGLGDGAGANIITRFGMCHPGRVHGIITINNVAINNMARFMDKMKNERDSRSLNKKNFAKFAEAYKNRTEILPDLNKKINFDFLLITGEKSKYVEDADVIHKEMTPGVCYPITESPARVGESLLLFCQGIGLLPSVARR